MDILRIECTLLILIYTAAIATSAIFKILRTSKNVSDGWERSTDRFLITYIICGQPEDHSTNCENFDAKRESENDQWYCSCPNNTSTLLFAAGEWKCTMNSKVRKLLDFDSQPYAFFQHENNDSQLRLLRANDNRRVSLNKNWRNCAVDAGSSSFIGCDGVIRGISNKVFKIWQGKDRKYFLKVTSNTSYTDLLRGKIIKITIHCTKPNRNWKMLFKFEGALNCFIPAPNLQPSGPTTTTTAIEASSSLSSSSPSPSSASFTSSSSTSSPSSSLSSPSTTTKTTASKSTTLPLVTASKATYTSTLAIPSIIPYRTMTVFTTPSIIFDSSQSFSTNPATTSYGLQSTTTAAVQLFYSQSSVTISTSTISIITPTTSIDIPASSSVVPPSVTISSSTISIIKPMTSIGTPASNTVVPSSVTISSSTISIIKPTTSIGTVASSSVVPSSDIISSSLISTIKPTSSIVTPESSSVVSSQSTSSKVQPTGSEISPGAFFPSTKSVDPGKSPHVLNKPFPSKEQQQSKNDRSSLGIISGIVTSSVLIIFIIVALLLYRHGGLSETPCSRRRREESKNSSKTSQIRIVHKPDGDDLYKELTLEGPSALYASTYDIPNPLYRDETLSRDENQTQPGIDDHFYAPLNFQQGCNIYGLGSNQDTNDSIYQNYGSVCIEQPIYSLLEELTTVQPMKNPIQVRSELVYNVPEEPDQERSENPNHSGCIFLEQPVYNTLESPFGSGEDPESINEPIYNVLEEVSPPNVGKHQFSPNNINTQSRE